MADPGDAVFPTVLQLREVGPVVQSGGLVTVDGGAPTYDDPDRELPFLTSPAISGTVTEESAKELGYDPQDLTLSIRVPPIDQTTCDSDADPDFPGLTITRRNNVGIYGPADAHDHTDWVGSGGVPAPNAGGEFEVTAAGSLKLTLACGYDDRLAAIAAETAPEGPPLGYMYRRANIYYPAWGANEAAYCWLGWERLACNFAAPGGSHTLTVTIVYRTYTFTDNHLSDSTRTTDFEYVATDHTATYSLTVAGGDQIEFRNPLVLIAPGEGDYPKLERVVSIEFGFATVSAGGWVIGEPTLCKASTGRLAQATQTILKTFEGVQTSTGGYTPEYGYTHGGASAHADAAFEWYDADEDNLGHANRAELTVRNFDHRISAGEAALDLTVAYLLAAWASIIQNVSEVFDCEENTTVTAAKLTDDEDPANTLSTLWAFNVCYPDCDAETGWDGRAKPLEQDVSAAFGDGAANCSLRCRTWTIARGILYFVRFDGVREGAAHGRALGGTSLLRNQTAVTNLWRRPDTTGAAWALVGSLDADAFGHWTSTSLKEFASYDPDVRYLYTVSKTQPVAGSAANIGEAYVREYVVEDIVAVSVGGVCSFWQIPRAFAYVFYTESGLKHVYTSPASRFFETGISQANYALPKTDSSDEDTSPSGYVDSNGKVRVFFSRGGALFRGTSPNWGGTWSETAATAITAADYASVFRSMDGTRQNALYVTGDELHHGYSKDHFATLDGGVLVATGADPAQPCGYQDQSGGLRAFVLSGGALYRWTSMANGVWTSALTPLTGLDSISVIPSADGTRQHAFYAKDGALYHSASADHFTAVQETATVAATADASQVSGYDGGQHLYAFGFADSVLTCWKSSDRGRTWTLAGTVA